jgi:hypothetical protein
MININSRVVMEEVDELIKNKRPTRLYRYAAILAAIYSRSAIQLQIYTFDSFQTFQRCAVSLFGSIASIQLYR